MYLCRPQSVKDPLHKPFKIKYQYCTASKIGLYGFTVLFPFYFIGQSSIIIFIKIKKKNERLVLPPSNLVQDYK